MDKHGVLLTHRRRFESVRGFHFMTKCKCGREYEYDHSKGHTKTKCNSCNANKAKIWRKAEMVAYKGGKCQRCGYDKCIEALTFHHRDPKSKKFELSGSHARQWALVLQELDKCDMLCANCHLELHAEQK